MPVAVSNTAMQHEQVGCIAVASNSSLLTALPTHHVPVGWQGSLVLVSMLHKHPLKKRSKIMQGLRDGLFG